MKTVLSSMIRPQYLKILAFIVTVFFARHTEAQNNLHSQSSVYEWPTDPLVKAKLEKWRDQKFGIIIHWGLYAVPGMIESWALCAEDWIRRDTSMSYDAFKSWYWGLSRDFNPRDFNPEQWAAAAKSAGMRYLVFTTKHHDGFNMFDTKFSNFKITNGPFAPNPRANVTKFVFDAFRKQQFMIGAYYSKPDWHSEYYWWPPYPTPDRNNNYDIRKHPWRWNKFKEFTYNQIGELTRMYGTVDILWLDGGWVRPLDTVNDEVRAWGAEIPAWSQDIDMPRIAAMARQGQPGLLIVDRTVHGPYENYQTPEQTIPKEKLDHPWESCITLGNNWGFVHGDVFKTPAKVIHMLIEVVAKGGNLLLGVGPNAEGTLSNEQVQRLAEIGVWMNANGEGIYDTRPTDVYRDGEVFFTESKDHTRRYALVRMAEDKPLPATVEWTGNVPAKGATMRLVSAKADVKWKVENNKVKVTLPAAFVKNNRAYPALVFSYAVK